MKRRIRLTESELRKVVGGAVRKALNEKHRPSGVTRRIHTRDANGEKQSFDYVSNLPKYNKGKDFSKASKFQRINAREVSDDGGEYIDTVLKDGTVERKGLHVPKGYYIVNNVGGTEQWAIDPKTFRKKYEEDPDNPGVYKPKGGPMLASEPLKRNTSFEAPWGGRMDMKAGSRILQDPTNPKDTYGIGGDEFDSTYRFDESRLRKVVGRAVRRVLSESGSPLVWKGGLPELSGDGADELEPESDSHFGKWSGMDMETPVVVVGGEHEGKYTLGEVIDTLPIVGVMEDSENPSFRIRTAGFPRIEGYVGPMWDGDRIRYESQEANDFFSA